MEYNHLDILNELLTNNKIFNPLTDSILLKFKNNVLVDIFVYNIETKIYK